MPDIRVSLDSLPFDALCQQCGKPVESDPAIRREEYWSDGRARVFYLDFGCWIGSHRFTVRASIR